MKIKKVFNVEYDLNSDEFKAQKQDDISERCQLKHPDSICKVTTFCVPDKQLVVSTTEENRAFMGAADKLLAFRPLADQSFLNMDDDMVKTWEIIITADTDLPDYVTALDVAQAKADEMFEADDSKLPLVTVIDYRWGNAPATLTATIFGDTDENGNTVPLINATAPMNIVGGNKEKGKNAFIDLTLLKGVSDNLKDTYNQMVTDHPDMNGAEKLKLLISIGADVTTYDTSNITSMANLCNYKVAIKGVPFNDKQKSNLINFNQDISKWDVSNVTNMSGMFNNCNLFRHDISNWDVSNVTNMYKMFEGNGLFNHDLSKWNIDKVTNWQYFKSSSSFDDWHVPDFGRAFPDYNNPTEVLRFKISIGEDVSNYDLSNITDLSNLLNHRVSINGKQWSERQKDALYKFNQDISNWDVSKVTDMHNMFYENGYFSQDISNWDVSNVTDMSNMFYKCYEFNSDISEWDVSKVTNMSGMFNNCNFRHDISNWDVSNVTNMHSMFQGNGLFNHDLSKWNVSKVTNWQYFNTNAELNDQYVPDFK